MTEKLHGKRALIYGGGTGLGLASAQAMLASGASVFLTGRRLEKLEQARSRLGQAAEVGLAAGDFTRERDAVSVTEAAVDFLGGLDTLIVSSGTSAIGSILTASRTQFEEVITTNLVGPFLAVRAAAPHLIRSAPSSVILIGSVVAIAAMKERVAYVTSKAGILGMTRAVALDLAEHGVRVNTISPGLVLTELAHEILSREADPETTLVRRRARHPLGRLGEPQDIGSAAVYLASSDSAWMTGQNLVIDGGLSIE